MLVGFTDSDWVGDPDDRKSTTGYVFSLGSGRVTWACKKQQALSLSLAEAEYRAIDNASHEDLWLRQILLYFWIRATATYSTLVRQSNFHQACQRSSSRSMQQTH